MIIKPKVSGHKLPCAVTGQSLGQHLEPIFLEHTTWSAWRKRHPDTLVLSLQTGFTRDYSRDPYKHYALTDRLIFPPARHDDRLAPKEWVLGVEIGEKFKAYPFSSLEAMGPAFSDSLHGQDYVVCWDAQARSAKVINQMGTTFPTLTAYWFAWYAFHPDTAIFNGDTGLSSKEMKALSEVC